MSLDATKDPGRAPPIPLVLEEVSADWLTAALSQRAPGLEVEGFEILSVRRGFSTIARLQLRLNAAGRAAGVPSTVILKGGFEPHSRGLFRTYLMEAEGYRDVWPYVALRTPHCYYVGIDADRSQVAMIMEDLVARGAKFCRPFEPQTYEQLARRLTSLAELHATTWDASDLKPEGRWGHMLRNGAARCKQYMEQYGIWSDEAWGGYASRPSGASVSKSLHDRDWARRALDRLIEVTNAIPNCIVHGDLHLGNLYEDTDGRPGFFDGNSRIEAAYFDLNYVIICGLDVADRRQYDLALVEHYRRELQRFGVDVASDEVAYYYKLYMLQSYLGFFFNSTDFQTDAFNTLHVSRFGAAMIDHGVKELYRALGA